MVRVRDPVAQRMRERQQREGKHVDPGQDWAELVERERINVANVVAWTRTPEGRLVWLEQGNLKAGLAHIIGKHGSEFAGVGISVEELPAFLMQLAQEGVQVTTQGSRPVYRIRYREQDWHVALSVGNNGFIVGANIVGEKKLRQLFRRQNAPTRPPTR